MALNQGWSYREQVGREGDGYLLVAYLESTRRHSTREEWAARVERGEIEIDGRPAGSAAVVRAGQVIAWHRPPWDEPDVPTHFDVLYEDGAIVAVNKPRGLPTMPAGGFLDHTLLVLVRKIYSDCRPLHRLGRHTSGIVLFARTAEAASMLSRSWREHEVTKQYRALGSGVARMDRLEIDAPIGPVLHPRLGQIEAASEAGRRSHSIATVLERRRDATLFQVAITTGRPHQIRIHLAHAGHPLVGDPVYQTGGVVMPQPGLPGDGGYFLHAERLRFAHPLTGMTIDLRSTPPPELMTTIA